MLITAVGALATACSSSRHCADRGGDSFCEGRFGHELPYCDLCMTDYNGCSAEPAPAVACSPSDAPAETGSDDSSQPEPTTSGPSSGAESSTGIANDETSSGQESTTASETGSTSQAHDDTSADESDTGDHHMCVPQGGSCAGLLLQCCGVQLCGPLTKKCGGP